MNIIKNTFSRLSVSFLAIILFSMLSTNAVTAENKQYKTKIINGVECIEYEVKKTEGIYRICKDMQTTENLILQFNPEVKKGLKSGMMIYIPVITKQTESYNRPEENKIHKVEKKQTIFRISKQYNISQEALIEANPQLKNRAVLEGEILKIPTGHKKPVENAIAETPVRKDTIIAASVKKETGTTSLVISQKTDTLDITFLLPFMTEQKPEISDTRFVEFYAGALVAIKEASQSGMNFNIHTFDTEKSELKMMDILNSNDLTKTDLIVGPAYASQISIVSDFAKQNHIKTIIPFSSKIYDLETNPYIYKFNPGQDTEINMLLALIQTRNVHVIFADLTGISPNDEGNVLTQTLKEILNKNFITFSVVTPDLTSGSNFQKIIIPQRENLIIFNTNKINNLISIFKELNNHPDNKYIRIYEPYSWKGTNIERPASLYFSVFKNTPEITAYNKYQMTFSQLFDWIPIHDSPRYDLLGYDLLQYSIRSILNETESTTYPLIEGVQSTIKFEKISEHGGFINKQLNINE